MAISVSMSFNTVIAISYTARLQSVCHFRSSMTAQPRLLRQIEAVTGSLQHTRLGTHMGGEGGKKVRPLI